MRSLRWVKPVALALGFFLLGRPAAASTIITYTAFDLVDIIPGDDRWQYRYDVSGDPFQAFDSFAIYFDEQKYKDLSFDPGAPPQPDWFQFLIPPDPGIPDQGEFDAVALVNNASLANPFVVDFVWIGPKGTTPGSQPFDVIRFDGTAFDPQDPGSLVFVDVLFSGQTVSATASEVPEPATIALLGSGLVLVRSRLKRRARKA